MNLSPFVMLKMGNKIVFKEPLQAIRHINNNNYMNSNVQRNNYYSPNNYSNYNNNYSSASNIKKRNYENMDIMPKFMANKNMQELNKELLDRLSHKKAIFSKMIESYFSQREEYFINSIQQMENEINKEKEITESKKNKDFEGFKDLLSFLNSNRTNPNLTSMQNMSLDDYNNMTNETKNQLFGGIYQNRPFLEQKLNLKKYVNNIPQNDLKKNPYSIYNNTQETHKRKMTDTNLNAQAKWNQGMNKNVSIRISKDQLDLFRTFIGNPNITDKEILTYFDMVNPKVMVAAERYFKKKYGAECLTLNYYFPNQQKLGIKIHKFSFNSDLTDLFMAAHKDFLSMNEPKLYTENGKQIIKDKRIKCLGALGLANNSKIKVIL